MPETTLTWGQLAAVIGFGLTVVGVILRVKLAIDKGLQDQATTFTDRLDKQCATFTAQFAALSSQIERQREESEAGRSRLYERVEKAMSDIRRETVPREVYERDRVLYDHIHAGMERQIGELARKSESACPFSPKKSEE